MIAVSAAYVIGASVPFDVIAAHLIALAILHRLERLPGQSRWPYREGDE